MEPKTGENSELQGLPEPARDAITAARTRLDHAAAINDVEGIIGAAKDLVETVAKAELEALGVSFGSNAELGKLTREALKALNRDPAALQGKKALQQLSTSLVSTAEAISQLRNTDGTGHGRAAPSNLDRAHADLVRGAAELWCGWMIATAQRTHSGRIILDQAVADIGGRQAFTRGTLPALLERLELRNLADDDQRKLGLAVARRWSVNHTFLALEDVIKPLAEREVEYPTSFREGVVEGLLLDNNGFMNMTTANVELAAAVGLTLPPEQNARVLDKLAALMDDAQPSASFDQEARADAATRFREIAKEKRCAATKEELERIARRIDSFDAADTPG
jgi:hypothetical protein